MSLDLNGLLEGQRGIAKLFCARKVPCNKASAPYFVRVKAEDLIVGDLAEALCKRMANQVRAELQGANHRGMSGPDSVLQNTWDEICVQLQWEESVMWDAYEETVKAVVGGLVAELSRYELEAIWLQTGEAWDSDDSGEELPEGKRPGVYVEAVEQYVIKDYVYPMASDWSNSQIRAYFDKLADTRRNKK